MSKIGFKRGDSGSQLRGIRANLREEKWMDAFFLFLAQTNQSTIQLRTFSFPHCEDRT